jgi:hypothetical protein
MVNGADNWISDFRLRIADYKDLFNLKSKVQKSEIPNLKSAI